MLGHRTEVLPKASALRTLFDMYPHLDFYYDGDRLSVDSPLPPPNSILHVSEGYVSSLDIYFQFASSKCIIKLEVPFIWTFGRAARNLEEVTGIPAKHMRFVFAGRTLQM